MNGDGGSQVPLCWEQELQVSKRRIIRVEMDWSWRHQYELMLSLLPIQKAIERTSRNTWMYVGLYMG